MNTTAVACPTCEVRSRSVMAGSKGWACGEMHGDGYHRARIRAALVASGRSVVQRRVHVPDAHPFFMDLRTGRYFDRVPGYKAAFVERLAQPLIGMTD